MFFFSKKLPIFSEILKMANVWYNAYPFNPWKVASISVLNFPGENSWRINFGTLWKHDEEKVLTKTSCRAFKRHLHQKWKVGKMLVVACRLVTLDNENFRLKGKIEIFKPIIYLQMSYNFMNNAHWFRKKGIKHTNSTKFSILNVNMNLNLMKKRYDGNTIEKTSNLLG